MKDERFDELGQMGYVLFMVLFMIFAVSGWLLDNELLLWISVFFLMYIPFMVCAITIRYAKQDWKRKKRRRERERHLGECKALLCRKCDRIYDREELDISSSTIPKCPVCNKKLIPID